MFQLPQKLTLYFYIPISRQSLCQAAVDTFRVYELDFSFVLSSLKQTPEQMESYYVNFITLFVTMNLCQPCCFFLFVYTPVTLQNTPRILCLNYNIVRAVARKKLQPRRTHGPLYEISRMKSSNIISLIKKIKIDSI